MGHGYSSRRLHLPAKSAQATLGAKRNALENRGRHRQELCCRMSETSPSALSYAIAFTSRCTWYYGLLLGVAQHSAVHATLQLGSAQPACTQYTCGSAGPALGFVAALDADKEVEALTDELTLDDSKQASTSYRGIPVLRPRVSAAGSHGCSVVCST